MVVAAVIKFISRKYPLFLKLLGTSKLRNRDPTFNEIGTQLFMKYGPSAARIGTLNLTFISLNSHHYDFQRTKGFRKPTITLQNIMHH